MRRSGHLVGLHHADGLERHTFTQCLRISSSLFRRAQSLDMVFNRVNVDATLTCVIEVLGARVIFFLLATYSHVEATAEIGEPAGK